MNYYNALAESLPLDVGWEVLLNQTQMELQLGVGVRIGESNLVDVLFQIKIESNTHDVPFVVLW